MFEDFKLKKSFNIIIKTIRKKIAYISKIVKFIKYKYQLKRNVYLI